MERIRLKTSRISFIGNYILGIMLLIFLEFINIALVLPSILIFLLIAIALALFLEPESVILYRTYFLDKDSVNEVKGILMKKSIAIPYEKIADRKLEKGLIGRIFNYGNVIITGFVDGIKMRGIKNPEKIYKEIENRIAKCAR